MVYSFVYLSKLSSTTWFHRCQTLTDTLSLGKLHGVSSPPPSAVPETLSPGNSFYKPNTAVVSFLVASWWKIATPLKEHYFVHYMSNLPSKYWLQYIKKQVTKNGLIGENPQQFYLISNTCKKDWPAILILQIVALYQVDKLVPLVKTVSASKWAM